MSDIALKTAEWQGNRIKVSDLSREEWLELRRAGIGGSDAGAIMGMSKYASPLSVYVDKLGLLPPEDENENMAFGIMMEPVIRSWLADAMWEKEKIRPRVESCPWMYRSEAYPWMIANLDGWIWIDGVRGILEIKTADRTMAREWDNDQVPDAYYAQCQHYMAVTGAEYAEIVCLLGRRLIWRRVPRIIGFIADLVKYEDTFWYAHVKAQLPPEPTGLDCDTDILLALHYEATGADTVDLSALDGQLEAHFELGQSIKEMEKKRDAAGNLIRASIGGAKGGLSSHFSAIWSRFSVARLDTAGMKKDHPAICEKYTSSQIQGRLLVKPRKEKEMKADGSNVEKAKGPAVGEKKPQSISDFILDKKASFSAILPAHVSPERFMKLVMSAIIGTPQLARADFKSMLIAVKQCAQYGLEPDGRHAAIVPFRNGKLSEKAGYDVFDAVFMPMVHGLIKLAKQSGEVKIIAAREVYKNDVFEYQYDFETTYRHVPAEEDRGELRGVYAYYVLKDGGRDFVYMSVAECKKWGKQYSKSYEKSDSLWQRDPRAAYLKTVARRVLHFAPISIELPQDFDEMRNVTPGPLAIEGMQAVALPEPEEEEKPEATVDPQTGEVAEKPAEKAADKDALF